MNCKLMAYQKEGFLSSLSIKTSSGLQLFTKDLVWVTSKERNKIIYRFMIFAEEIGVDESELNKMYELFKQQNYEIEPRRT